MLLTGSGIAGEGPLAAEASLEPNTSYLVLSCHDGRALQVADASRSDLANVNAGAAHGGVNQSWRFIPVLHTGPDPVYVIKSLKTGKVLDVVGYSKEDDANVQQFKYFGSNNQKWRLKKEKKGGWRIISVNSGQCLEVDPFGGGLDVNVRQHQCSRSDRQLWRLEPHPHADVVYEIISKRSKKALDLDSKSKEDGVNIQQFQRTGADNQLWVLSPQGQKNGRVMYAVISCHSGKVLDVKGGSRLNGANIQQHRFNGDENQLWFLIPESEGFTRFVSVNSGKCLDVQANGLEDGGNIQQHDCNGGENQLWRLEKKEMVGKDDEKQHEKFSPPEGMYH